MSDMPCRMIQDKGVLEFVKAARILRTRNSKAIFRLQGNPDPGNPTSIKQDELEAWVQEGVVEWIPHTKDINATLAKAHIIALPSYREGFPKTLVDAAAAGRACVASDVPGCRHAIVPGEAGLLFRVKDPENLADVLGGLLADESKISEMGKRARKLAENRYGIEQIVEQHLYIYAAILRR
jgi:glycosyltransferase involved in cell wall biosynthesis